MACRIVTARRQQRQQKRNLKSIEEEEDESVKKMYLYNANQPPKSLATTPTTPTPWRWLNQVDVPWIIYEKVCVKARKELHHSLRITYSTAEAKKKKKSLEKGAATACYDYSVVLAR